jgi:hypothetical protein
VNSCLTCGRPRLGAANSIDLNPNNDGATVEVGLAPNGAADLKVTGTSAVATSAESFAVTVQVTNAGPGPASTVVVEVGSGSVGVVGATGPSGWDCSSGSACWSSTPLAAGATASFEYRLAGTPNPALTFASASIKSWDVPDSDTSNNSSAIAAP